MKDRGACAYSAFPNRAPHNSTSILGLLQYDSLNSRLLLPLRPNLCGERISTPVRSTEGARVESIADNVTPSRLLYSLALTQGGRHTTLTLCPSSQPRVAEQELEAGAEAAVPLAPYS